LRIPEKYQKYRYAKISQLLDAGQFCRYVGGIQGFGTLKKPSLIVEICSVYRHING
jgi:hypothetical protein